jgi:hypothetical protein
MSANLLEAADLFAANDVLQSLGCTDGLPVLPPTPERVEALILATGQDGDTALGAMGPAGGAASVHKVAVNAAMAGCQPDHMPVLLAAVKAVLQPEFDLGEMQGTTHCTAPLVIVNGPAQQVCGEFASGFGLFGPGQHANGPVGRALRLCMLNIGGARPGESDMAVHGHPGKYTFCIAEDEALSPLPPLHTTFGYDADDSVVTVVGAEAPHSTWFVTNADDPLESERLLDTLAGVIANPGSNNVHLGGVAAVTVVLNHEHAQVLTRAGMDRAAIQRELAQRATIDRQHLLHLHPGAKLKADDGERIPAVRDPAKILIVVAGGPGLYSMVMPSWCAGPHRNSVVYTEVDLNQFCEVPGAV